MKIDARNECPIFVEVRKTKIEVGRKVENRDLEKRGENRKIGGVRKSSQKLVFEGV